MMTQQEERISRKKEDRRKEAVERTSVLCKRVNVRKPPLKRQRDTFNEEDTCIDKTVNGSSVFILDHSLTIVLFGNSAAAQFHPDNILLGELQPNIKNVAISRTVPLQMKKSGRHVSVINLIDIHETALDLDSLTAQLVDENEIITFVFVVRLGQLTDADKMGIEWLQRVFGDRVLQFVMILFTYESQEESDSIIDDLKKNSALEQLIEKCGGRYHTCSKNMNKPSEMKDLMTRIEQLFIENKQQCYTSEMYNIGLRQREDRTQQSVPSQDQPTKNMGYNLTTETRETHRMKISGHHVSEINLIDIHETALDLDSLTAQLVDENEIIAFVFVVRLGQLTDTDKMGIEWLQRVFGDRVLQFVMILFTYEIQEESDSIIDDLKKNSALERLIEKCGGRYHICSKNMNKPSEIRDLMNRIEQLFIENKQQCYTSEMYNIGLRQREDMQNRTQQSVISQDQPTKNMDYTLATETRETHRQFAKEKDPYAE
ncbi:interferon-induced very large GTPase 1-like protein [Labeo rohita]|uniref:Interferon-induced very large GTPase 1-like protein n=1 Tax=Labeo rohita TaxID=84645 RepID=A0A498LDV5_LABRO|nr:interferon-induced very large GTPase 1-like protein [Labeo rohita]